MDTKKKDFIQRKREREWILHHALLGESGKKILKNYEKKKNQSVNLNFIEKSSDVFQINKDDIKSQWSYWQSLEAKGYWYLTILDEEYPRLLKNIPDPPAILFGIGEKDALRGNSLAIVGTRKATNYGLNSCRYFSKALSLQGLTIVSGLALGIDTMAHKACVEAGGTTVAIMGCGIDTIYPDRNISLAREIIKKKGAILTEFPPKSPPLPYHFHQRNRILSGLAEGVLVVEAKRKSGTMITVRFAGEQGRDVFAIPGNINQPTSLGTNEIIQWGGKLCIEPEDILNEFPHWQKGKNSKEEKADLTKSESLVYDTLLEGPLNFDELLTATKLSISLLSSILISLEMKRIIQKGNLGKYEIYK